MYDERKKDQTKALDQINLTIDKTVKVYLNKWKEDNNSENSSTKSKKEMLTDVTEGLCLRLSALTILALKNSKIFKQCFLIRGTPVSGSSFHQTGHNNFHVYGIAKSVNEKWYGFSPANYKVDNPSTSIFVANSLETLITNIQNHEGGKWPNIEKTNDIQVGVKKFKDKLKNHEVPLVYVEGIYSLYKGLETSIKQSNKSDFLIGKYSVDLWALNKM